MSTLERMINFIKLYQNRILLLVIIIISILWFRSCSQSIADISNDQNIRALTDSIRVYITKNGQLVYEKSAFLTKESDLKKLNSDLFNEVKNLKDHPIVVIKWNTKLIHDTIKVPVYVSGPITWNNDSTIKYIPFAWNYDTTYSTNNYHMISGDYIISIDSNKNAKTESFRVTRDEIGISMSTGLTESKDGNVEIFIKSMYPGFAPTKIDGALFDPRESDVIKKYFPPKRFAVGPYVGYGVYLDPIQGRAGTGVSLGISFSYNVFQWNFK